MKTGLREYLKSLNQVNIKKSYAILIVTAMSALCTFFIFSASKIFFTALELKVYKPVPIVLPLQDQKVFYPVSAREKSIYLQDSQAQVLGGIGSNFFRQPITTCDNGLGHRRIFCRVGFYIFEILDRAQPFLNSENKKNSIATVLEDYTGKNSEAAVAAGLSAGMMGFDATEIISLMSDKKDDDGLKSFVDGWAYYKYSQASLDKNINGFCKSHVSADLISYCEWGAGRALYVYHDVNLPSLISYAGSSTVDGYLFSKSFEDFTPIAGVKSEDDSLGETAAILLKKIFYQLARQLSPEEQSFVKCINSNKHILDCGQFVSAGF